ncbi:uncharacterized protein LOC130890894 [Diorhabda carinulata]|uniref:uncharacterized protein LOC130890894 n=1 Tax=Diorhabda carinulata TaxID=1163345 RepID=UPI0025A224FB|nr:uncharacterized protein LOC130890894 [Diorhabda carinulata]
MASDQLAVVFNCLKHKNKDNNSDERNLHKWEYNLKNMSVKQNPKMFVDNTVQFMESIYALASSKSYTDQIFLSRKHLGTLMNKFTDETMEIFIKYLIPWIIEKIIDGNRSGWCIKKEHLKCVNTLLPKIMNNIYFMGILIKEISPVYIYKLIESLHVYGDFDLQIMILKTIFSVYGKIRIIANLKQIMPDLIDLRQDISQINEEDSFREDCRKFLNKMNANQGKIFSLQCKNIQLNESTYVIPMESICGVWVDFNLLDNVMSWQQKVSSNDTWEVITLFSSEVETVFLGTSQETFFVTLNISGSCISSIAENQDTADKIKSINLVIENSEIGDALIKDILPKVFGTKYKYSPKTVDITFSMNHKPLLIDVRKRRDRDSNDTIDVSLTRGLNPISFGSISYESSDSNNSMRFSDTNKTGEENLINTDDPNLPGIIETGLRSTQILAGRCSNKTFNYKEIIRSRELSQDSDNISRSGHNLSQSSMFFSPKNVKDTQTVYKMDRHVLSNITERSNIVSSPKDNNNHGKITIDIEKTRDKPKTFTFSDIFSTCTDQKSSNNLKELNKRSSLTCEASECSENRKIPSSNTKSFLNYEEQVISTLDAITENSQQKSSYVEASVIESSQLNDNNKLGSQNNVKKGKESGKKRKELREIEETSTNEHVQNSSSFTRSSKDSEKLNVHGLVISETSLESDQVKDTSQRTTLSRTKTSAYKDPDYDIIDKENDIGAKKNNPKTYKFRGTYQSATDFEAEEVLETHHSVQKKSNSNANKMKSKTYTLNYFEDIASTTNSKKSFKFQNDENSEPIDIDEDKALKNVPTNQNNEETTETSVNDLLLSSTSSTMLDNDLKGKNSRRKAHSKKRRIENYCASPESKGHEKILKKQRNDIVEIIDDDNVADKNNSMNNEVNQRWYATDSGNKKTVKPKIKKLIIRLDRLQAVPKYQQTPVEAVPLLSSNDQNIESSKVDKAFDALKEHPDTVVTSIERTIRKEDSASVESKYQSQKHNESTRTVDLNDLTRSQQIQIFQENEHHKFVLNQNRDRSDNSNIRKENEDQFSNELNKDYEIQDSNNSTQLPIESKSKIGKHHGRSCSKKSRDKIENQTFDSKESDTKLNSNDVTKTSSVDRKCRKLVDVNSVPPQPTKEKRVPLGEDKIKTIQNEDIPIASSSVNVIDQENNIIGNNSTLSSNDVTKTSKGRRRRKLYDVNSVLLQPTEEKRVPIDEGKIKTIQNEDIPIASSSVNVIDQENNIIGNNSTLSSNDVTKPLKGRRRRKLFDVNSVLPQPTEEKRVPIDEGKIKTIENEDIPTASSSVNVIDQENDIIGDNSTLSSNDVTKTSRGRRRRKLYNVNSVLLQSTEEKRVTIDEGKIKTIQNEDIPPALSSVDVIDQANDIIGDNSTLSSNDVTKTSKGRRCRKLYDVSSVLPQPTEEKRMSIDEDKIKTIENEDIPIASSSVNVIDKENDIIGNKSTLSSNDVTKTSEGRRRRKLYDVNSVLLQPTEEKRVLIDEDKTETIENEDIPCTVFSDNVVNEIIQDNTKLNSTDIKTPSGRRRSKLYVVTSVLPQSTEVKRVPIDEDKTDTIENKDIPFAAYIDNVDNEKNEIIDDITKLNSNDAKQTSSTSQRRRKLFDVNSVLPRPTEEKRVSIENEGIPFDLSSVNVTDRENDIIAHHSKLSSNDITKTSSVDQRGRKLFDVNPVLFPSVEEKFVSIDEDNVETIDNQDLPSSSVNVIDRENDIFEDNIELTLNNLRKTISMRRKEELLVEASPPHEGKEKTEDHTKLFSKDPMKTSSVGRKRRKLLNISSMSFQLTEEEKKIETSIDENENIVDPPKKPRKDLDNNEKFDCGYIKIFSSGLISPLKGMSKSKKNFSTSTKLETKKKRKSQFYVTYSEIVAEQEAFKRKCRNLVRAQKMSIDEFYKRKAKRKEKHFIDDSREKKLFKVRPITSKNYDLSFSPKPGEWDELKSILEFDRRKTIRAEKSAKNYSKNSEQSRRNTSPKNSSKEKRREEGLHNKKINIISNICIKRANEIPFSKITNCEEQEQSTESDKIEEKVFKELKAPSNNIVAPWSARAFFNNEFITIDSDDYIGKYLLIFFYPFDCGVLPDVSPSSEIEYFQKHFEQFQQLDIHILGCSVDSIYTHKLYITQLLCKNESIDKISFPLIGDSGFKICKIFNVIYPNKEHSYRALVIINPEGIIIKKVIVNIKNEILLTNVLDFIRSQKNSR